MRDQYKIIDEGQDYISINTLREELWWIIRDELVKRKIPQADGQRFLKAIEEA